MSYSHNDPDTSMLELLYSNTLETLHLRDDDLDNDLYVQDLCHGIYTNDSVCTIVIETQTLSLPLLTAFQSAIFGKNVRRIVARASWVVPTLLWQFPNVQEMEIIDKSSRSFLKRLLPALTCHAKLESLTIRGGDVVRMTLGEWQLLSSNLTCLSLEQLELMIEKSDDAVMLDYMDTCMLQHLSICKCSAGAVQLLARVGSLSWLQTLSLPRHVFKDPEVACLLERYLPDDCLVQTTIYTTL